jgi:hypothetical protein
MTRTLLRTPRRHSEHGPPVMRKHAQRVLWDLLQLQSARGDMKEGSEDCSEESETDFDAEDSSRVHATPTKAGR